jgi:hypothetical protein
MKRIKTPFHFRIWVVTLWLIVCLYNFFFPVPSVAEDDKYKIAIHFSLPEFGKTLNNNQERLKRHLHRFKDYLKDELELSKGLLRKIEVVVINDKDLGVVPLKNVLREKNINYYIKGTFFDDFDPGNWVLKCKFYKVISEGKCQFEDYKEFDFWENTRKKLKSYAQEIKNYFFNPGSDIRERKVFVWCFTSDRSLQNIGDSLQKNLPTELATQLWLKDHRVIVPDNHDVNKNCVSPDNISFDSIEKLKKEVDYTIQGAIKKKSGSQIIINLTIKVPEGIGTSCDGNVFRLNKVEEIPEQLAKIIENKWPGIVETLQQKEGYN